MKKGKRWLTFLTTVAMLLTLVTVAAQPTLSTDRKVYKEGEPILVTASGSVADKDWVGIQPKNDPDTKGNSIYWYYLTEETNGKPVDIKAAGQKSNRQDPNDYNLPAGDYIVYLVPKNGYAKDKTETVDITIEPNSSGAAWNGTDMEAPQGSGSENDPYLIENAAQLAWMSAQIGDGSKPTGVSDPFAGKYFLQNNDIDLNGHPLPSIGYYYHSPSECAVFGGIYNGQGHRIYNGSVCEPDPSHEFSVEWGSGLFGAVFGATIRNVRMDGLRATGLGVVGTVVGLAGADTEDSANALHNQILNCSVSASCSVQATYVNTESGKFDLAGRIGGIVGMACGTTVRYCVNEGAIKVLGNINYAGGIAGTVGFGATLEYCVNKADIVLDNETNANKSESAFGGIAGFVSPYGKDNPVKGDLLIRNCYNTGSFRMKIEASPAAISYGGILGSVNTLTAGQSYVIENCYNLNESNDLISNVYRDIRIGGLVGCGWQEGGASCEALVLKNSASVQITSGACISWYAGVEGSCNEFNIRGNKNAAGNVEITAENVSTKTAEEMSALIAGIDIAIENAPTGEEPPVLATDRAYYLQGESIFVTAYGSEANKDWIGIQPKNDTGNSIYWYYITEETNGKPVDIKAVGQKSSRPNADDYDLPAGDYIVYLVPNNGYAKDKTEIVEITIKDHVAPDRRDYIEGEPILVTGTGSAANKDWIGIQPKDDNGSSIYWYYITAETDRKPVDIKAVGQKSNRPDPTDYDLPAGTYIVYFVPSNGYASAKTETAEIVIRSKDANVGVLEAPSAITYTLKNETDGMADGTVTVTLPDGSPATDLLMYWCNADGILEGYTALAKFQVSGAVTEHDMTPNTLIPQGATALRVYAMKGSKVSEGYAEVALPAGAASGDFGDPLNEFQVISDIHLNLSNEHLYNENFRKVLADIAANSPGSTGIYINGDIANTGKAEEYANMWEIYNAAKAQSTLPGIYLAIGNHDFFGVTGYKEGVDLFLENAYLPGGEHPDQLYYDFWKDGYHFIFLGSDRYPINNVNAYLSKTQLDWLDAKLAESRNINAPTFVFLHQSLSNTVAGSFEGQGWSGATPEAALRAILKKYPEVIFFNGHSHWTLNSEGNMYARDGKLPTIFNTSSTAYLWTSYKVAKGEALAGSEGYYVRIYADKVVVLGRNFTTGEWMPSAMYVVDYSDVSRYLPEDQNGEENNGNEQNTDPVVTTDDPGSGTAPAGSENTGCRSVGSLAWSLLASAATAVLFLFPRRKRREE